MLPNLPIQPECYHPRPMGTMIISRATMVRGRAPVRAAIALAVAAVLGACFGGGPEWPDDDSLTVILESAPINLDPRVGTDQASARVWELMANGLVTKDPSGNLVPDLAESWEVLDNGSRYRFHLRPGVVFHDGSEFDASDVVWTYQAMINGAVTSSKVAALEPVERLVAVDPLTVDFHLKRPHGPLLADLTSYMAIVPEGAAPQVMNRHPVGTGPFRFESRTPDRVELVPFAEAFEGAPNFSRLVLKEVADATVRVLELRRGSAQIVVNGLPPDSVPRFRGDPNFRVEVTPGSNYQYIGFNLQDPVLSKLNVRRAIAHAIDREQLVESLLQDQAAVTDSMMPEGHWARAELTPNAYDPVLATRLLEEAGFPDPDDEGPRPRLTVEYKTSTTEYARLQAEVIQQMLAAVGIELEIRTLEFATFLHDVQQGSFQMYSLRWTGVLDPHLYYLALHSASMPPNGANRNRFNHPRFDRLIELGARSFRPEDRRPHYVEAQEILNRELPYISLFHTQTVAVRAQPIQGYVGYPSAELYSLKTARWVR